MARTSLLILLLVGNIAHGQVDARVTWKGDSVVIEDSKFIADVFGFGEKPLHYLKTKVKGKLKIESTKHQNEYVEGQVDTSFHLTFGKDNFQVYQTGEGKEFLIHADVSTNRFRTKNGIRIGMKKSEMIKILIPYTIEEIPKFLFIGNFDYAYLTLAFKGDVLNHIVYDGYLD